MINYCVDNNADLNALNSSQETPLFYMIKVNDGYKSLYSDDQIIQFLEKVKGKVENFQIFLN